MRQQVHSSVRMRILAPSAARSVLARRAPIFPARLGSATLESSTALALACAITHTTIAAGREGVRMRAGIVKGGATVPSGVLVTSTSLPAIATDAPPFIQPASVSSAAGTNEPSPIESALPMTFPTPPQSEGHSPQPSHTPTPPISDQTVVLITSCLQHDFFTRFPKRKETMNRYWVGRKESERVLGLDPARGPLAQLMTWVRQLSTRVSSQAIIPYFQQQAGVDDGDDKDDDDDRAHHHMPHSSVPTTITLSPATPEATPGATPAASVDMHTRVLNLASGDATPGEGITHMPSSDPSVPPIYVIHLRTWIEPSKPYAKGLIEKFGEYCIAGTEGAKLVNKLEENLEQHPNECIINTTRQLSTQTSRALKRKLQQIRAHARKTTGRLRIPLRVAVIGGWTDEDVYHVCYELRTRLQASDIATCSILTASPSSSQHWNALSQLKRVMNVTVTRTVKELIQWLGVADVPYRLPCVSYRPRNTWPIIQWSNGDSPPSTYQAECDTEILSHLYRNAAKLTLDVLVGGYSPSIVLSVQSEDSTGVREVPSVVKLATREDIATEYQAFQRVEEIMGNNAPSLRGFVEIGDRAGLKFRYTRMSAGKVLRLLDLFQDLSNPQPIIHMIDTIYDQIFGAWYGASTTEMFDLFSYYFDGFSMSHGEPVSMVHQEPTYLKTFISYVLAKKGTDPAQHFKKDTDFYSYPPYMDETFAFPKCAPISNLGILFEKSTGIPYLRTLPPRRLYSTFAHGDANLQNFLIDARGNVWVIDFFFTEPRNHVLRDISKMWSCVMYLATEIHTDDQFAQAFLISQELAQARELHSPLPETLPGLVDAHLKAIYAVLIRLWTHAGRMVKDRSNAVQFQLALVADAMRFFLYTTKNMYSKRYVNDSISLISILSLHS